MDLIGTRTPHAALRNQPGSAQHSQMMRKSWLSDIELGQQLHAGAFAIEEQLDDAAAGWIGNGTEGAFGCIGAAHTLVMYITCSWPSRLPRNSNVSSLPALRSFITADHHDSPRYHCSACLSPNCSSSSPRQPMRLSSSSTSAMSSHRCVRRPVIPTSAA